MIGCEETSVETRSAEETERLGGVIAGLPSAGKRRGVAGRTGVGENVLCSRHGPNGLGEDSGVRSPTFTLVNEYRTTPDAVPHGFVPVGRGGGSGRTWGTRSCSIPRASVPWNGPSGARELLPARRLDIFFEHAPERHRDARRIVFCSRGLLEEGWQEADSGGGRRARAYSVSARRAARRSRTDWKRLSGSFAMVFRTIASSFLGIPLATALGAGGISSS